MYAPDGIPNDFEQFVLKWIGIPLLILGLAFLLLKAKNQEKACQASCRNKGYTYHRYIPSGRLGAPEAQCYCRQLKAVVEDEKRIY